MKYKTFFLFVLFLITISLSCNKNTDLVIPLFEDESILKGSIPLEDNIKLQLEGEYEVLEGGAFFGKTMYARWNGNYFTFFTGKNYIYLIFQAGLQDSSIYLEGFYRYAMDVTTGLSRLAVDSIKISALKQNKFRMGTDFTISGKYSTEANLLKDSLKLKYIAPLKQTDQKFWIIAHRGGGRNSDQIGASENSLSMIKLAERFGANGVELDVRLNSDGVPILYHDESLNSRLVTGEYCIGPISNYPFAHLRTLCTLTNGEKIPTLEEALNTVVDSTGLNLVWLDIKSVEAVDPVVPIQKKYNRKGKSKQRDLQILLGLSSDEIAEKYLRNPDREDSPALCELDPDDVRRTGSAVWAPRWTLGPLLVEVEAFRIEKIITIFWTVDQPEFIQSFLKKGKLDGILTNYPSIVFYEYYSNQ